MMHLLGEVMDINIMSVEILNHSSDFAASYNNNSLITLHAIGFKPGQSIGNHTLCSHNTAATTPPFCVLKNPCKCLHYHM